MASTPRRILLKLSGEALKGPEGAFSPAALERIAGEIAPVPFGLGIVVGAGNIVRGGAKRACAIGSRPTRSACWPPS